MTFPFLSRLPPETEYLTATHIRAALAELLKIAPPWDNAGLGFLSLTISAEVLRFFLGDEWTNANVLSIGPREASNPATMEFLRSGERSDADVFKYIQRVANLAEHLFNLQHVEGARERISRLRGESLPAALAEFEAAGMLSAPDLHVRFQRPGGVRGEDYEGTIVTALGRVVAWEAKSKLHGQMPSSDGVWRSLEEARKQLPKNRPGLVLVRMPDEWAEESRDLEAVCKPAVAQLLRQSKRIVGVVVFWRVWEKVVGEEDGDVLNAPVVRLYPNAVSPLFAWDIPDVLARAARRFNPEWVQLQHVVLSSLPDNERAEAEAYFSRVRLARAAGNRRQE